MGVRIIVEHLDHVQVRSSIHRIAANPYAGRLADSFTSQLPDSLVGQRPASGNDANVPFFMNVTRSDADATPPLGILPIPWRDQSRTIRTNKTRFTPLHSVLNTNHVLHRDALRDANHQIQIRIHTLKNGIGGKGGWNKYGGSRRSCLFDSLRNGIKNRNPLLKLLPAFAWGDTGDDLAAVIKTQFGMATTKTTRDALNQYLCI